MPRRHRRFHDLFCPYPVFPEVLDSWIHGFMDDDEDDDGDDDCYYYILLQTNSIINIIVPL